MRGAIVVGLGLVKHVTGVEPREDSRERARFIKSALELKNVDFRPGVVETLGVDISRAYSAKLQLEQSAYRAVEKVQQYQATASTYDTLKAEAGAAARAAGFTSVSDNDVVIDYWLECNGARQSDYNTVCSGGQSYARWITVDIPGTFTPMFSSRHWPGANTNGTFTLHGKAGLRTQ